MPVDNYEAYEAMPYQGSAHRDTHPSHLSVMAGLRGLSATSPHACRVLELGCARGSNLIPMAASLAGSEFVGIDLSDSHIDYANAVKAQLGLNNVVFLKADIMTPPRDLGEFDYIIAHGIYSWLPLEVRRELMRICGTMLTSNGVAYISFNTYPGWHRRDALRQMMLFHTRAIAEPGPRVRAAKALLGFLSNASSPHDVTYKLWLNEEMDVLANASEWYVFHDHLAVHNRPFYLNEVVAEAASEGLRYLGDGHLPFNFGRMLPDRLRDDLIGIVSGDEVGFEQYQDFVINRTFRKTLLCRADVQLLQGPATTSLAGLHVLSAYERDSSAPDGELDWICGTEQLKRITPATDALMELLAARWPSSMPVTELFQRYRATGIDTSTTVTSIDEFCRDLLVLAQNDVVVLNAVPITVAAPRTKPIAAAWVRNEQSRGVTQLTSVHHKTVTVSPALGALISLADGTRTRDALFEGLVTKVTEGRLELPMPDATPEQIRLGLMGGLDRGLLQLRHLGVLL